MVICGDGCLATGRNFAELLTKPDNRVETHREDYHSNHGKFPVPAENDCDKTYYAETLPHDAGNGTSGSRLEKADIVQDPGHKVAGRARVKKR